MIRSAQNDESIGGGDPIMPPIRLALAGRSADFRRCYEQLNPHCRTGAVRSGLPAYTARSARDEHALGKRGGPRSDRKPP